MCRTIQNDLSIEKQRTMFLFEHVFPEISAECGVTFESANSVWLDRAGVDMFVNAARTDLKATTVKAGCSPRSYCFEKRTRNRNSIGELTDYVDGWFVSKKKITEKYLLCYFFENEHAVAGVTLVLIDRAKLANELLAQGIDIQAPVGELISKSSKQSLNPRGGVKYFFPGIQDVTMTHSVQLAEQPVNFIVNYHTLCCIADWEYSIGFEVPKHW